MNGILDNMFIQYQILNLGLGIVLELQPSMSESLEDSLKYRGLGPSLRVSESEVWSGAQESAFPTSSQEMPVVPGPHCEKHWQS